MTFRWLQAQAFFKVSATVIIINDQIQATSEQIFDLKSKRKNYVKARLIKVIKPRAKLLLFWSKNKFSAIANKINWQAAVSNIGTQTQFYIFLICVKFR